MLLTPNTQAARPGVGISWRYLPDLPHALGGQFVGVIDNQLVVAGGSYFDVPPWSGGKKQWVDTIYVLGRNDKEWRLAGHLPSPLGYGVAISLADGMLCIGGQTPAGNSRETLHLRLQGGQIVIDRWADLPQTASNMAGARAGDTVYIAGGQTTPESTHALHEFWVLPLANPREGWRALPAWPGAPRIFPVAIASGTSVCVLSGSDLTGTVGPPVGRRFLTDAYCYEPTSGWQPIRTLPRPTAGGMGTDAHGRLLVFGGNDGSLADREYEIREKHPGFSKDVLCFDPSTREWRVMGTMPLSLVTTGMARWGDEIVIAGGEDHPAHRSAKVIAARILETDR